MKPFRSANEMLDAHELMFGLAGRQCADIVVSLATTLFAVPLDVLNIRVVLAPVELGPYNRHAGYHYGKGQGAFILGNRHIVELQGGTLVLKARAQGFMAGVTDFIVHELTHMRQAQLLAENPEWEQTRGVHRDLGWYTAVEWVFVVDNKNFRPRAGGNRHAGHTMCTVVGTVAIRQHINWCVLPTGGATRAAATLDGAGVALGPRALK
jgi:hypothetical protein